MYGPSGVLKVLEYIEPRKLRILDLDSHHDLSNVTLLTLFLKRDRTQNPGHSITRLDTSTHVTSGSHAAKHGRGMCKKAGNRI